MKITAYMNLRPQHINLDTTTGIVSLTDEARQWNIEVCPDLSTAEACRNDGESSYEVVAELPDGSIFEVRGDKDQTEGRGGTYLAGLFDNYPAAYAASAGLGVMGRRGHLRFRPAPERIYRSAQEWQESFDAAVARKAATVQHWTELRGIVQLAADDERAIGAADPAYAVWLKLNEKYGAAKGSDA